MNAIGKSSVVFVTLSGLFWGGWILGSQTPEGQEAIARAYAAYTEEQATANEDLFNTTALRAVVCGEVNAERGETSPCLGIVAAGRLFIVDAGSGSSSSLSRNGVPVERLEAVLLTQAGLDQTADLSALYGETSRSRDNALLPVYGPADTQRLVDGLNQARGFDGAVNGLQAWGPGPEPGRPVIVFEADGLIISAFTSQEDAFAGRIGYRFDYRGRSIVVGGDGSVSSAAAARGADVILQGSIGDALTDFGAQTADPAKIVLTGAENQMAAQVQVAEARRAGLQDVVAGRIGMVLELPLENSEVTVRAL